jgi:hypothetical protein
MPPTPQILNSNFDCAAVHPATTAKGAGGRTVRPPAVTMDQRTKNYSY